MKTKLIIALDDLNIFDAMQVISQLGNLVDMYKVNSITYLETYTYLQEYIRNCGKQIFLDLKFHDIPKTVFNTAYNNIYSQHQRSCDFFTFHLSSGVETIALIAKSFSEKAIGVALLTSLGDAEIYDLYNIDRKSLLSKLVTIGYENGINKFVCSGHDLHWLKLIFPKAIFFVPGLTLGNSNSGQKMSMLASECIKLEPDYVILGRSIIELNGYELMREELLKLNLN